jgi:hypothetical protein
MSTALAAVDAIRQSLYEATALLEMVNSITILAGESSGATSHAPLWRGLGLVSTQILKTVSEADNGVDRLFKEHLKQKNGGQR